MTEAPNMRGAFRTAQRAALKASGLSALGITAAKIFSGQVVGNASLPYVVAGDDQVLTSLTGGCADEAEIFGTVHFWGKDDELVSKMVAEGKRALLAPLQMPDVAVVDEYMVADERYLTDPAGSTHGVLTIHYLATLLEPAAAS
jgi:hypothetical protein